MAVDVGEPGDQRGAVFRLEFAELAAVDDTGDDLADVVGHPGVDRHHVVEVMLIGDRIDRDADIPGRGCARAEGSHDASHDRQCVAVVSSQMISDTRFTGMQIPAAEVFGGHDLAGSGLHQWRPAEEDRALVLHDYGFITHRGHVCPTGRA